MRVRTPEQQFIDALCCDIAVIAAFAFLAGVGSAVLVAIISGEWL